MEVITVVEYKHIFDGPRPNAKDLLKDISSRYIIAVMAMINDVLSIRGNTMETQAFLMYNLAGDFPEDIRNQTLARAGIKLKQDFEIFNFPYTVEMINRELVNFKTEGRSEIEKAPEDILAIFKAYLSIVQEVSERDTSILQTAIEDAKKGGDNFVKLMWPHLMRQYQFANRPEPFYEINRSLALLSFLESHPEFGEHTKEYFKSLNCYNYQDYSLALLSLLLPHLKRQPSPNLSDYLYKIITDRPEPVLESLVADPLEIGNDPKKQLDYLGLKERPIFRFEEDQYIVPYWDFFINALFTGFVFSFYSNSGIKSKFQDPGNPTDETGFGKFKGKIGKEFSEGVLFKNTMVKCFSRQQETLLFFDDSNEFNPDCYYRQGNLIFIIEFKDYLLSSEVIQSASYDVIKDEIDKKFVSEQVKKNGKLKRKDKGVSQLARNIEKLAKDQAVFWKIDPEAGTQRLNLVDMTIYPIIVQTSIYFDFPGINDYLNNVIQDRLGPIKIKFKRIAPFTMIDFRYFEQRLLLFSDARIELADELDYYHNQISILKEKANGTRDVNDSFSAMMPFSFMESPTFRKEHDYRLSDLRKTIERCWNFSLDQRTLDI